MVSNTPALNTVLVADDIDEDELSPYEAALQDAVHMLHEQAHGIDVAWRFCRQEPCRNVSPGDARGPAPLSLDLF